MNYTPNTAEVKANIESKLSRYFGCTPEEASKELTNHYVSLIDWFYSDYSPVMYKRTYGLYNSYKKFNK